MRNIDEQMSIVNNRVKELKQEKKRRNSVFLTICSTISCIVVIGAASINMPSVMSRITAKEYSNINGFASIFSSGNSMGYLMIALLSFVLGICLTLLCIYLHKRATEDEKHD